MYCLCMQFLLPLSQICSGCSVLFCSVQFKSIMHFSSLHPCIWGRCRNSVASMVCWLLVALPAGAWSCRHSCRTLGEAKALGALVYGLQQAAPQLVVWLVHGQIQLVEAGVCTGQAISGSIVPMDLELLNPVHALQRAEALQRHFRCASDELQELGAVRLVKATQCTPEPLNLRRFRGVLVVLGVRL